MDRLIEIKPSNFHFKYTFNGFNPSGLEKLLMNFYYSTRFYFLITFVQRPRGRYCLL